MLMLVVILFSAYKFTVLEGKKSIDIIQAVRENHFDDSDKFGHKQGLNVAIALYDTLNPDFQPQIDPSYGRVAFKRWRWDVNENGM